MELLNAMHVRPIAGPSGSANIVAVQDDVPLQGYVPFEPTTRVEAGGPEQTVHDPVEASHHVDSCEGFSTPKKVPINSTLVSNLYP
jgi:hypothetical protein